MRNARGCTHFESIVGNVNISQCDSLMKLLSVAPSSSTVIFKRLKSKQKYLGIMERLTLLLRSLTVPDLQLTPDRVLLLLREAAALVQRVGMSLEASCVCLPQAKPETREKVLKVLAPLLLKHCQLVDALYHNPAVVKLLPVLMSAVLATLGAVTTSNASNATNASNASNASSGGGAGSAGVGSRVNERLFDEATLLWVALAGSECPKEKASEALARYFLLLDVFRAANRHTALATQSHTLFFNLSSFKTALRLSSPLPTTLATVSGTINTDSSLLQPLAPPRRALASLPLLTPQPPPPRLLLLLLLPPA